MSTPNLDYAEHQYPYIVAFCRIMSSHDYWIKAQIERARARKAPKDCYSCSPGEEPRLARDLPASAWRLRGQLESETGISIDELVARS